MDLYLEIRSGTCGKVDSFDRAGAFIEWDVGLIGENDVHAIGAISAVKPNELWAQRVCFENFLTNSLGKRTLAADFGRR